MNECEHCGNPLECFEGETYCVDCTRYEAIWDRDRATDEALTELQAASVQEPDPSTRGR